MRNNFLLIVLTVALIPLTSYSRDNKRKQFTVAGVIIDKTGESLPDTTVYVKNTPGMGTSADMNGKLNIKIDANQILIIQAIGMKSIEKLVTKDGMTLRVTLEEDDTKLDEVVVAGMTSQKKMSVVGVISTTDVTQPSTPSTSLSNMIGGRLADVITMQSSSEPGENISSFWTYGIGTFGTSSGALALIDDIEGRLKDISPGDVKSFSILKDASATAVYDTQSANGVVLVTTKRRETDKLTITGRTMLKISRIKRLLEYLRAYDYTLLANEARAMSGEDDLYSRLELDLIKYNLDKDLYPDINWIDEITKRTSIRQNHYINAQGGGDIVRYYFSLGYQDEGATYRQEGNLLKKPLSCKKITCHANIDMNLTKTTEVYFDLDGYISNYTSPSGQDTSTIWSAVRQLAPLMFPRAYSNGTFPPYGRHDLASPYVMLSNTGYTQDGTQHNILTLKLEQEFGGLLRGITASVQAMSEDINCFNERRYIWPGLYRVTGRSS